MAEENFADMVVGVATERRRVAQNAARRAVRLSHGAAALVGVACLVKFAVLVSLAGTHLDMAEGFGVGVGLACTCLPLLLAATLLNLMAVASYCEWGRPRNPYLNRVLGLLWTIWVFGTGWVVLLWPALFR